MSVIVLGTIDSMGASNMPKKALPIKNGVYVLSEAIASQIHATIIRRLDRRYTGRLPYLIANGRHTMLVRQMTHGSTGTHIHSVVATPWQIKVAPLAYVSF